MLEEVVPAPLRSSAAQQLSLQRKMLLPRQQRRQQHRTLPLQGHRVAPSRQYVGHLTIGSVP